MAITKKKILNKVIASMTLSIVYSALLYVGMSLKKYDTVKIPSDLEVLSIIGMVIGIAVVVGLLFDANDFLSHKNINLKVFDTIFSKPWVVFLILLICWIPCYLSVFPGNFVYDAEIESLQPLWGYHGDFPRLHSVIINGLLYGFYELTGTYNTGIAIFVILQMILLSLSFTDVLCTFRKYASDSLSVGFGFIYYALFPNIHMLVVSSVRDVMFSGLLNYCIFLIWLMNVQKEGFWLSKKPILFGVILALTVLARNNNTGVLLTVLLCVLLTVLLFIGYKYSKKGAVLLGLSTVGVYCGLSIAFSFICQPFTHSNNNAALSFMSQSLVRSYLYENELWTDDDLSDVADYMNLEYIKYIPNNADCTKYRIELQNGEFKNFFSVWINIGKRHKHCFLDAILLNSMGAWYPDYVLDGYNRMEGSYYQDFEKSYFKINEDVESPAKHMGILPRVLSYYEKLGMEVSFEEIPVVSWLFSIGAQTWLVLFSLAYFIYRKRRECIAPIVLLLIYIVISSFAPLIIMRYFATLFLAFPMIVCMLFNSVDNKTVDLG